jgi:DNA-nicking Smr family endonuclease
MAKRGRKAQDAIKDWHLWSEVTRTIAPLRPQKPVELEEPQAAPLRRPDPVKKRPPPNLPSYSPPIQKKTSGESVIEPGLKRRLARGHVPIDATIDLHGLTQVEAQSALQRFITARAARGDRTLLVITGKGIKKTGYGMLEQRGVLRAMLPRWLAEPALAPLVAGHEPAGRGHGGEGAFYVRLKRGRE